MPKEEWGVKRLCPTTGKRFYDLNKSPVVSPYTGEVVNLDTGKASRVLVADKEDAKTKAENEEVVLEDDDDVDVLEDDEDSKDPSVADDILDDDDDDNVSLEEIADVPADDDEG